MEDLAVANHWYLVPFTDTMLVPQRPYCGLGEIVRAVTKYNGYQRNSISFALFSLGMTESPLPIWIMRDSFLAQITQQGMPADYVATLEAVSSPAMLIVMLAAPLVTAMMGAFIAKGMFKKHFTKAGIV